MKGKKLKLELSGRLPTLNYYMRLHWGQKTRIRNDWAWLIQQSLMKQNWQVGELVGNKVRVSAVIYLNSAKKMHKDINNLRTVIDKVIIDQLVCKRAGYGIIPDDSDKHLVWGKIEQKIDKSIAEIVVVTLTRIP